MRLFDPETPLMRGLSTLFDWFVLSLTALLCALPLFTAGTSAAALYAVMLRRRQGGSGGLRLFFRQFRRCFPKAALGQLAWMGAAALLTADSRIVSSMPAAVRVPLWAGLFFLAACLALAGAMAIPLTALDPAVPFFQLWKRALFLGIARLPRVLLMLGAAAAPAVVFFLSPVWFFALGPVWLFLWPAATVFLWVLLTGNDLAPDPPSHSD